MKPFLRLTLLVTLPFAASAARADDTLATEFVKSVFQANKKLRDAGFEFGKQLGPIVAGNPADLAALTGKYSELVMTLKHVKSEMQVLKTPESKEAKDLSSAHQGFLRGQTTMIEGDLAEILSIAVHPRTDAAQKKEQIQKLLEEMTKREQSDSANLMPAIRAFLVANDIDIRKLFD